MNETQPRKRARMRGREQGFTLVQLLVAAAVGTVVLGGAATLLRGSVGMTSAAMAGAVAQGSGNTLASALEQEIQGRELLMVGRSSARHLELLQVRERISLQAAPGSDIRAQSAFAYQRDWPEHLDGGEVALVNGSGDVLFTNMTVDERTGSLDLDCPVTIPAGRSVDLIVFDRVGYFEDDGQIISEPNGDQTRRDYLGLGRNLSFRFLARGTQTTHTPGNARAPVPLALDSRPLNAVSFTLSTTVAGASTTAMGSALVQPMARTLWECGQYVRPEHLTNGTLMITTTALGTHDERNVVPTVEVQNAAGQTLRTVRGWHHNPDPRRQVGERLNNLPAGHYTALVRELSYGDGVILRPTILNSPSEVSAQRGAAINVVYRYVQGGVVFESRGTPEGRVTLTNRVTGATHPFRHGDRVDLDPGTYDWVAAEVTGFQAPQPASGTVIVRSGETLNLRVDYLPVAPAVAGGSLRIITMGVDTTTGTVNWRPQPLATTGRMTLPNGQTMNVAGNNVYSDLTPGNHQVRMNPVAGWLGPSVVTVQRNVQENQESEVYLLYSRLPNDPPTPDGREDCRLIYMRPGERVSRGYGTDIVNPSSQPIYMIGPRCMPRYSGGSQYQAMLRVHSNSLPRNVSWAQSQMNTDYEATENLPDQWQHAGANATESGNPVREVWVSDNVQVDPAAIPQGVIVRQIRGPVPIYYYNMDGNSNQTYRPCGWYQLSEGCHEEIFPLSQMVLGTMTP